MHLYHYVYGWNRQNLYAIMLLRGNIAMYASEKHLWHVDHFYYEHLFLSGGSIYLNREAVDVSFPHLPILTTVLGP